MFRCLGLVILVTLLPRNEMLWLWAASLQTTRTDNNNQQHYYLELTQPPPLTELLIKRRKQSVLSHISSIFPISIKSVPKIDSVTDWKSLFRKDFDTWMYFLIKIGSTDGVTTSISTNNNCLKPMRCSKVFYTFKDNTNQCIVYLLNFVHSKICKSYDNNFQKSWRIIIFLNSQNFTSL